MAAATMAKARSTNAAMVKAMSMAGMSAVMAKGTESMAESTAATTVRATEMAGMSAVMETGSAARRRGVVAVKCNRLRIRVLSERLP